MTLCGHSVAPVALARDYTLHVAALQNFECSDIYIYIVWYMINK